MINKQLPLYPNPTMTCGYECKFKDVCVAMDDGGDWKFLLRDGFQRRPTTKTWEDNFAKIAMNYKRAKDRGERFEFTPPESNTQRFDHINIIMDDDDSPPWGE